MEAVARREAGILLHLIAGRWISQAICVAANLDIADRLGSEPRRVEDLASELGCVTEPLQRLLRALASVGVFRETAPRSWVLSPAAALLRSDASSSLRGLARFLGTKEHYNAWGALEQSVRHGDQPFEYVHGEPFWDLLKATPPLADAFNTSMTSVAQQFYSGILSAYDFSRFRSIVDVGGGEGELALGILERYPHLRATVFDLPDVAARARERIARTAMCERGDAAGGSFLETVPSGADLYMLAHVVHNWDDDSALTILRNIRRAMHDDSLLLLAEQIILPGNVADFAKLLDLEMLVLTNGGKERTEDEFKTLLTAAGLQMFNVISTSSGAKIIEARPLC